MPLPAISQADKTGAEQAARALERAQEACGWLAASGFIGEIGVAEARIGVRANRQLRRRIAWALERAEEAV